jgi:hypothetical protein
MPVRIQSRYRPLGVYDAPDATGTTHPTVPIRRHEPGAERPGRYQHRVTGLEDIEYLAWRFHGSGEGWWRLADANGVRFPLDLLPGDVLAIPPREEAGRIVDRGRRF